MGSALKIRDDLTPLELRRWARVESYGRAAARAYGIANAMEEMPRADAARLAGMDRQTLRDAAFVTMQRDWRGARPSKGLSLAAADGRHGAGAGGESSSPGPLPERDGVCAWTKGRSVPLAGGALAKTYHPSSRAAGPPSGGWAHPFPPEGALRARPREGTPKRRSASKKAGLRDIVLKATAARIGPPTAVVSG